MTDLTSDTHHYDGKLQGLIKEIFDKIPIENPNMENIYNQIRELSLSLKFTRHNQVIQALGLFENDKQNNYDPTNKVSVEDILPRLWIIVEKWEDSAKLIFLEQIADVVNGSCSQGRTTRLFQLII